MAHLIRRRFLQTLAAAAVTPCLPHFPVALDKLAEVPQYRPASTHFFCLGYIHRRKGDADMAIADLTRAINAEAGMTLAYPERAWVHAALGHHEQAESDDQEAFDLMNKNVNGERAGFTNIDPTAGHESKWDLSQAHICPRPLCRSFAAPGEDGRRHGLLETHENEIEHCYAFDRCCHGALWQV